MICANISGPWFQLSKLLISFIAADSHWQPVASEEARVPHAWANSLKIKDLSFKRYKPVISKCVLSLSLPHYKFSFNRRWKPKSPEVSGQIIF